MKVFQAPPITLLLSKPLQVRFVYTFCERKHPGCDGNTLIGLPSVWRCVALLACQKVLPDTTHRVPGPFFFRGEGLVAVVTWGVMEVATSFDHFPSFQVGLFSPVAPQPSGDIPAKPGARLESDTEKQTESHVGGHIPTTPSLPIIPSELRRPGRKRIGTRCHVS